MFSEIFSEEAELASPTFVKKFNVQLTAGGIAAGNLQISMTVHASKTNFAMHAIQAK